MNASNYYSKEKPKNVLTDAGITAVTEVYWNWKTREQLSQVVILDEIRSADYNLSPSQFIKGNNTVHHRTIREILTDLAVVRAERERSDDELAKVLASLGLDGEVRE